eukprot:5639101-Pyramimonas_sp.AAC.1
MPRAGTNRDREERIYAPPSRSSRSTVLGQSTAACDPPESPKASTTHSSSHLIGPLSSVMLAGPKRRAVGESDDSQAKTKEQGLEDRTAQGEFRQGYMY